MKLKISRLFHWLYATLMFLPLLMFIPSCLYYGFNEHATNETITQINYKYQSNEVNTLDDLVQGNIYEVDNTITFDIGFFGNEGDYLDISIVYFEVNRYSLSNSSIDDKFLEDIYDSKNFNFINLYVDTNIFYMTFTNSNAYVALDLTNDYVIFDKLIFIYNDSNNLQNSVIFNDIKYTDYNVIESVETNVQDTISNKMYLAWESIWNLPLFQWTKNSFITAPFSYITGLFGLGSDNSLNCVFTYFASISICWLVFDLIMYVPNLAHRWLDRSAIE